MPIPILQAASAGFGLSSGAQTLAFNSNVTKGNLLLVAAIRSAGGGVTIAVTDTLGNSYNLAIAGNANSFNDSTSLYYCVSNASGANTVTVTPSGGSMYSAIAIAEYSLVNQFLFLRSTASTAAGGGNLGTISLSITPLNDADLKVCAFSFDNGSPSSWTATSGTVEVITNATAGPKMGVVLMDSINGGTFTFSGNVSPNGGLTGAAASFLIFPQSYAPQVSIGPKPGSPMFRLLQNTLPTVNVPPPPPLPFGPLAYSPAVALGPQPGTPMFRMFQKQAWTVVNFTPPPPPSFVLSSKVVVQSRLSVNSGLLSSGRRPDRPRLSES